MSGSDRHCSALRPSLLRSARDTEAGCTSSAIPCASSGDPLHARSHLAHGNARLSWLHTSALHCVHQLSSRIDRLVQIIIGVFLPSAEGLVRESYRKNKDHRTMEEAFRLWESALIRPRQAHDRPCTLPLKNIMLVSHAYDRPSYYTGMHKTERRYICECPAYQSTGKFCTHIWSAYFFNKFGDSTKLDQELERNYPAMARVTIVRPQPIGWPSNKADAGDTVRVPDGVTTSNPWSSQDEEELDPTSGSSSDVSEVYAPKRARARLPPGPAPRPLGIRQERPRPTERPPTFEPQTVKGVIKPVGAMNSNGRTCWLNSLLSVLHQSPYMTAALRHTSAAITSGPLQNVLSLVLRHLGCLDADLCQDPTELLEAIEGEPTGERR